MMTMNSKSVLAATLFLMFAFPAPLRAGDQVPYKDCVEARIFGAEVTGDTAVLGFEVLRGQATFVGRFTTIGTLVVDLGTLTFTGTNSFTAANGDQIEANIVSGTLTPTGEPHIFVIQLVVEFTGGTGRFTDVTGGFTGAGMMRTNGESFVGATFAGTGEGTISSPGSRNRR